MRILKFKKLLLQHKISLAIYLFLGLFLVISSTIAWIKVGNIPELPVGCDQFGHIRIAHEIRIAIHEHRLPEFRLIHPQVQMLIQWLRSTGAPVFQWEEMLAPHAHHYVERSQSVVDQYPPGTGILMSLFPENQGALGLNRLTIFGSLILGEFLLIFAWRKKAWISAGFVTLGCYYGIQVIENVGIINYSMNAIEIPLCLAILFGLLARLLYQNHTEVSDVNFKMSQGRIGSLVFSILAGMAVGITCLVRSPLLLQVPGWFILLPTRLWISFAFGGILFGFLPLAWYQYSSTGAWWATTYNSLDASLPNWKAIGPNFRFYLVKGLGAKYFVIPIIIGFGFWGWTQLCRSSSFRRRFESSPEIESENYRIWLVFGWIWGISALYYFTHNIAVEYYMVPAHITVVGLFAGTVFFQEQRQLKMQSCTKEINDFNSKVNCSLENILSQEFKCVCLKTLFGKLSRKKLSGFLNKKMIALIPLLAALLLGVTYLRDLDCFLLKKRPWPTPLVVSHDPHQFTMQQLPEELQDPHSWIWADLTNGAFWVVAHKPAFRIKYRGSLELRKLIYNKIKLRNETQFLVMDGPSSDELFVEFNKLGAELEDRGRVFNNRYYKINWPER